MDLDRRGGIVGGPRMSFTQQSGRENRGCPYHRPKEKLQCSLNVLHCYCGFYERPLFSWNST